MKLVNLQFHTFSSVKGWVYVAVWVDGSLSSFVVHPTASQCHHERCTPVHSGGTAPWAPQKTSHRTSKAKAKQEARNQDNTSSFYFCCKDNIVLYHLWKWEITPKNLSQNNWRTLKVAPFMRFPLLSVTHHYHLIQSMSISQYGLHLYQAHRCQTKLCQTGCCFTRFLSSTSSLSCSMLCKPCNVCNGGSPLEITFRWMRWKKSQQANLLVPKLNLQNSPMQVKIIFCSHNSAKLCPMCRPLIAAGSSNLLISLPGRCRILKVCSGNLARWQSRRTNQGIETTQPTDFAKNLLRSQGTRHKRRLLPCFHAVQCQCSTECAEILAGRRILSGRK